MNLPPQQPMTPQRVLNLVGGTILGLAFFVFMLTFVGLNPAHAQQASGARLDSTPDYVLIIVTRYGYSMAMTSAHFEDEQACLNAANARKYLITEELQQIVAVCAAEQSE